MIKSRLLALELGGWTSVSTNDDRIKAVAEYAVLAQSAAMGTPLKLVSV
ncbi:MAG: hypothetical protein WCO42_04770 [bacterium]